MKTLRCAILSLSLVLVHDPALAKPARPPVLISGVYLHGYIGRTPNDDSAVRLINTDPVNAVDLAGLALTDAYTPRKRRKGDDLKPKKDLPDSLEGLDDDPSVTEDPKGRSGRGRPAEDRTLVFPPGAKLPPGGELWVASTGRAFLQIFGEPPAYEANDTGSTVPDMVPARGFLWLQEGYGTVALLDRDGDPIDFVAWQGPKQDRFGDDAFDEVPWNGDPVALKEGSIYGWTGRVLRRARDTAGRVVPDTDRAADWPVGFGNMRLGTHPTHRVELAGQSQFLTRPIEGRAKVVATSAPDNNFDAFVAAIDSAKKELRVRVYEFTNPKIADAILRAKKRGVKVLVYLEGAPVGGLSDQGRWISDRFAKANIPVHFLATPKDSKMKPRYRFDHSKYVIVDDRRVVIGTENYGRTGVPVSPTFGNRGWMIHIEQPEFVKQLRAVWDHDYRPGVMPDLIDIHASPSDSFGLPYRDPAFVPSEKIPTGAYRNAVRPVTVEDKMKLELVMSPDTSMNEETAIIGLIGRAKKTLYLEQNSIIRFWGPSKKQADRSGDNDAPDDDDDDVRTPSLPMQAVLAAARRGVKVRVLLDGTWYNAELEDERDNDNTAAYLNELGRREGLDIEAKVINLEATSLEKIHAKGVIVDDQEVFVGSINWSENAFFGNREIGVVVTHPAVAGYYADLFRRDWSQSRLYQTRLSQAVDIRERPDANAPVIGKRNAKDRVEVVAERGAVERGRPAWVSIPVGGGKTGYIPGSALGELEVTAKEAMYVVGRDAVVSGRVEGVRASEKVTQLQLGDSERAPFVAVIFKKDDTEFEAANMPPATFFSGREVRIRGRVKAWKVPEIILTSPKQIELVK